MEPGPAVPKTLRTADDLFFGSCPVHLQAVPGETVNFVAGEWAVDMGEPALAVTLARKSRQAAVPGGPADVVVPCIPARELVCTTGLRTCFSCFFNSCECTSI